MSLLNTSTTEAQNTSRVDTLRSMLLNILMEEVVKVKFTKVNGEVRELLCTLDAKLIPPQEVTENSSESKKKANPNVLSVWDVENDGWRSFRLDSVITFGVSSI